MAKLLNLGCGQRFNREWINVDFVSSNKQVIAYNLLNGIPYRQNEFDVVYHSHVLEHFTKEDGRKFITECYRVLKPEGIIRIAVPDLEHIVRNYLSSMEGALAGDSNSVNNYEWMMLELYDQTVRNQSGGEMAKYFYKDEMENEQFVFSRVGLEGKQIRERFLKEKNCQPIIKPSYKKKYRIKRILNSKFYLKKFLRNVFKNAIKELDKSKIYTEIGKFRLGGEIHQWMYDRYSLSMLLKNCGFLEPKVTTAYKSQIPNWDSYNLESKNGVIYKPDSLFMEAIKK